MGPSIGCSVRAVLVAGAVLCAAGGASAEAFVDLYVGAAVTSDTAVSIQVTPAGGPSQSLVSGSQVDFDISVAPGGRGGYWLESLPWLGAALDLSFFQSDQSADAPNDSEYYLRVIPLSALLMLRQPFLTNSAFPRGQLQLYAAAGPGVFRSKFSGFGVSDTSVDLGVDVRAGLKLFHLVQSWGVFVEYRFTRFEPSTFKGTDSLDRRVEAEFGGVSTHYFLFGTGYHF
jgi:opacity protein-like surface antigen